MAFQRRPSRCVGAGMSHTAAAADTCAGAGTWRDFREASGEDRARISARLSDPAIVYMAGIIVAANLLIVAAVSSGSAASKSSPTCNVSSSMEAGRHGKRKRVREGTGTTAAISRPEPPSRALWLSVATKAAHRGGSGRPDAGGDGFPLLSRLVPASTSFPHWRGSEEP